MPEWAALGVALATTLCLGKPVVFLLRKRRIVDLPNERSSHVRVTPRGGGIAVTLGIWLGLLVGSAPGAAWGIFAGSVAAAAVGFVDDLRGLSAVLRLGLQGLLSLVMTTWLLLGAPLSPWEGVAAGLVCVVGLIGYVNAFNFMDGINGISAASAAAAGGWFLLLGREEGELALSIGAAALLGAAVGFLPWNVPIARMFLGDVGSYGVGLYIGGLAVAATVSGVHPVVAVAPLLLYVTDTAWTLGQRLRRGDPWREAHREHIYQRLCDVGWSHIQVSGLVLTVTLIVCGAVWLQPFAVGILVSAPVLAAYVASPRLAVAFPMGTPDQDVNR